MSHRWNISAGFGDVYGLGNHGTMRVSAPCLVPIDFPRHHLSVTETQRSRVVDKVIGAFYFVRLDLFSMLGGFDARYSCTSKTSRCVLDSRAPNVLPQAGKGLSTRATSAPTIPGDPPLPLPRQQASIRAKLLLALASDRPPRADIHRGTVARLLRRLVRRDGAIVSSTIAGYTKLLRDLLLSTTSRDQRTRAEPSAAFDPISVAVWFRRSWQGSRERCVRNPAPRVSPSG